ncbi:hypothetical protein PHYBLDRAFT_165987 [Phycomyces blakesleeanus NRRL 1555(-)]|uniref:Uncharacterized protein n=1 Tax=Phycomyces blakesleeanus (strain ATCC 8743b / DSM 1359 / FGSC 10004 / NBRC 33097 / NRRL 1555) TaxID=763407 RepID=A0A162UG67_PHYB8|nr:hypothetical protein PHYBLDRAFT_165987 [Phycomyces blakesleeanus NRRL 1555(-)]OAD76012.1 hypothetical protein PHYBLDRAFT_165987 [Phycomyces blakesleeanus NRRL 1555(-)]|eukprot:XP_018294052.1 hypothetical protein PHYBLDRAFT_165987 [Phycomyces blakesleeanus NRRL 1555(-)]
MAESATKVIGQERTHNSVYVWYNPKDGSEFREYMRNYLVFRLMWICFRVRRKHIFYCLNILMAKRQINPVYKTHYSIRYQVHYYIHQYTCFQGINQKKVSQAIQVCEATTPRKCGI